MVLFYLKSQISRGGGRVSLKFRETAAVGWKSELGDIVGSKVALGRSCKARITTPTCFPRTTTLYCNLLLLLLSLG